MSTFESSSEGNDNNEWRSPWDFPPEVPIVFNTDTPITNEGHGEESPPAPGDTVEEQSVAYNAGDILPEENDDLSEDGVAGKVTTNPPLEPTPEPSASAPPSAPPFAPDKGDESPPEPAPVNEAPPVTEQPDAAFEPEPQEESPAPLPQPVSEGDNGASDSPQPFGVEHFDEENLTIADKQRVSDLHQNAVRNIFDRYGDYVDETVDLDGNTAYRIILDCDTPDGSVAIRAGTYARPGQDLSEAQSYLVADFDGQTEHRYNRPSDHPSFVSTVRRYDINSVAVKEGLPHRGKLPESELRALALVLPHARSEQQIVMQESDMGINRFAVGPRQMEYVAGLAAVAEPRIVPAGWLYIIAKRRADTKTPPDWDEARRAAPAFDGYISDFLRRQGHEPSDDTVAEVRKTATEGSVTMNTRAGQQLDEFGTRISFAHVQIIKEKPSEVDIHTLLGYNPSEDVALSVRASIDLDYRVVGGAFVVSVREALSDKETGKQIAVGRNRLTAGDNLEAEYVRNFLRLDKPLMQRRR